MVRLRTSKLLDPEDLPLTIDISPTKTIVIGVICAIIKTQSLINSPLPLIIHPSETIPRCCGIANGDDQRK
jgi:hypothetical protein